MAVFLLYRRVSEAEDHLDYEILTAMDDPSPVRVRFAASPDAPLPVITGSGVIANRAIRMIAHRRASEGSWPSGGLIQS